MFEYFWPQRAKIQKQAMVASLVATRVMFHWNIEGRVQGGEVHLVTSAGGGCLCIFRISAEQPWKNLGKCGDSISQTTDFLSILGLSRSERNNSKLVLGSLYVKLAI
jgi:hypothetical protein